MTCLTCRTARRSLALALCICTGSSLSVWYNPNQTVIFHRTFSISIFAGPNETHLGGFSPEVTLFSLLPHKKSRTGTTHPTNLSCWTVACSSSMGARSLLPLLRLPSFPDTWQPSLVLNKIERRQSQRSWSESDVVTEASYLTKLCHFAPPPP